MIFTVVSVGEMQVNCYILAAHAGGRAVIIDPGSQASRVRDALVQDDLCAGIVINTHGHYDHIGGDNDFHVPVYIHAADRKMLSSPESNLSAFFDVPLRVTGEIRAVNDGDLISCDGVVLKVAHLPGHTAGGMALILQEPRTGMVFTGDSLFYHSIGRTDLEDGDEPALIGSVRDKILTLPAETLVYPGHGRSSSVGEERSSNPFLR